MTFELLFVYGPHTTISNAQILQTARTVSLELGVSAAAVERAGISGSSICKRYPTKEALFLPAMSEPPGHIWIAVLEAATSRSMTGCASPVASPSTLPRWCPA
jgi:hypothetical protein